MKDKKIQILGSEYVIKVYNKNSELFDKGCTGFCGFHTKEIALLNLDTDEDWNGSSEEEKAIVIKQTLRHEVIHAYLYESGLAWCSNNVESWALNEEMVDWLAIQSPKIFKTFNDLEIM